tara:strand:+ start:523 stop:789 length:267 start_codon:yes stop_codon:yes gene_type:complete
MAIKVSVPSTNRTLHVAQTSTGTSAGNSRLAATVVTGSQRNTTQKLATLADVDVLTNGLYDGYSLVYDQDSGMWITKDVTSIVDGGTY